ncbi:hypothetical protein QR680_016873 [Steinernema hermaphroditum]|uniref:K Homology domain-containing protein n=1 Tax=Steinernema hermaphroditum TaxID=289476 RepID=A0AA39LN53_9BILA|nr:hypothetical protein QR680_016873 [Steinernema hermaphroditum]
MVFKKIALLLFLGVVILQVCTAAPIEGYLAGLENEKVDKFLEYLKNFRESEEDSFWEAAWNVLKKFGVMAAQAFKNYEDECHPEDRNGTNPHLHDVSTRAGPTVMDVEMNLSVENGEVVVVEAVEAVNGGDAAESSNHHDAALGAPGDGRPAEKVDYNTDFPQLPISDVGAGGLAGAWGRKPVVKASTVTIRIALSAEERAARGFGQKTIAGMSDEQTRCSQIHAETGAKIDLSEARDNSVNILISGKPEAVEKARSMLVRTLQAQITREISIPKDHHRIIIGKNGSKLKEIQDQCDCKIDVPKRDNASDVIKITGPSEGIARAVQRIQAMSAELAKTGSAEIDVPKSFYPWIRGPNNEFYDKWTNELDVRINIPPSSAASDVIVITGEREAVEQVEAAIRKIYAAKRDAVKTLTVMVPRAQHRYIVGPQRSGIHEILRQTDVVVEVPAEDEQSDQVTLRGEQAKLGDALTLVYAKATSIVSTTIECPPWMHKMLIGPKGATLESLIPNKEKVKIDFEKGGLIYIEGAPKEVEIANEALQAEIDRLTREVTSESVDVNPLFHKHIIGRNRAAINKIREKYDVQVIIPHEDTHSPEVRVEGKKEGVAEAIKTIKETVARLENEKTRDILIPQRFHGQFIGPQGAKLNETRKKYPSINFSFPEAKENSEVVTLRGDRQEVDKCFQEWSKKTKELLESSYQETLPVFKEFCKHIIGKGGSKIGKIRQETGARIELPAANSDDSVITVTGKKEQVQKAVAQLTALQNELSSIVSEDVVIPQKVHFRFVAGGRRLVREVEEECGGVHIKFPAEKSNSDKVSVRGPKDDVAKAVELLKKMAKDCEGTSFQDSVLAKAEYHRFFIGKGGSKINKLSEQFPTVRVIFPREADADKERIQFIGAKDEVVAIKKVFEQQIAELNDTTELTVVVDPKHHSHFVAKGAQVLNEIQSSNGNVIISFPRKESKNANVTIKGAKNCAEAAKQRIIEIVEDLEAQVTIPVVIAAVHHRTMFSVAGRARIQKIQDDFNVHIKFPERKRDQPAAEAPEAESSEEGEPKPEDLVHITGRDTKCEKAKEALLAVVPVSRVVNVPNEYHRSFIGQKGENVRQLMNEHDVNIKVPGKGAENADEIVVTGIPEHVEAAIKSVLEKLEEYEKDAEDRRLRNFRLDVVVDPKYHQRLIGQKGATISDIRTRHNVQVSFPPDASRSQKADPKRREVRDPAAGPDVIILTGYEHDCEACKAEILQIVADIESLVTEEIELDPRYHPRLIGSRGRNLKLVQEKFHVEIRLPRKDDPNANPSLVVVAGKNADDVAQCVDHLRIEEEDYMQDVIERYGYISQRQEPTPAPRPVQEFQITGAPWQLQEEQFPSMGDNQATPSVTGVWGNRANRV